MANHTVYSTEEACYLGHGGPTLVRLDPPMHGWEYYCTSCQAMVMTHAQLEASLAEPQEEGVIGRVCALPLAEPLRWQT